MRIFSVILLVLTAFSIISYAQHEYAPIEKKEIEYKDWTYRNAVTDEELNLREFTEGKKLVLVFYFAPWCHSSNYQAPMTQKLFEKYKDNGLGIIGVSMYDTVEALRMMLKSKQITFPVVVESTELSARRRSRHYKYRWSTGDHRKWGTPWNIFIMPSELKKEGKMLTETTFIANGELVEEEAEAFIRERLGLPPDGAKTEPEKTKSEADLEECKEVSGRP